MNPKKNQKARYIRGKGRKLMLNIDETTLLYLWIEKRIKNYKIVNVRRIKRQVKKLTNGRWIPSNGWVSKTMKDFGFIPRRIISKKPQQSKPGYSEKVKEFRKQVWDYYDEHKDDEEIEIWAMD